MRLKGKRILFGVGGSISAYKAADLVRLLIKQGADVEVMMSESAQHFITPLTLEVLSGRPVLVNAFQTGDTMPHIHASRKADVILIAPATANQLAKFANGMADDIISMTVLAATCPVVIAPAMNKEMWNNVLTKQNVSKLLTAGYTLVGPASGDLACGEYGEGRFVDFSLLQEEIVRCLTPSDLANKKVLITLGPTREYADPVRFLSNGSTGRMGFALAREAYARGAEITAIVGPLPMDISVPFKKISVMRSDEMLDEVLQHIPQADIFIANAAVSDYRFESYSAEKMKKGQKEMKISLRKTEDILEKVLQRKKRPFTVGFALETSKHYAHAAEKIRVKKMDMLVLNDASTVGKDETLVTIFSRFQPFIEFPKSSKDIIAKNVFDEIVKFL